MHCRVLVSRCCNPAREILYSSMGIVLWFLKVNQQQLLELFWMELLGWMWGLVEVKLLIHTVLLSGSKNHSIAERVRKCSHLKHCYRILLMCMYIASFAVVYLTTNSFGSHENSHCRGLSLSSFNLLLLKRCEPFLLIIVFLLEGTQGEDCEKFEIFAGASSKC